MHIILHMPGLLWCMSDLLSPKYMKETTHVQTHSMAGHDRSQTHVLSAAPCLQWLHDQLFILFNRWPIHSSSNCSPIKEELQFFATNTVTADFRYKNQIHASAWSPALLSAASSRYCCGSLASSSCILVPVVAS